MTHNPILEELYAIRQRLLADAGGDIHKFLAGVRDREAASGRLLQQGGECVGAGSEPNVALQRTRCAGHWTWSLGDAEEAPHGPAPVP